jgi:transposase-like protein
MSTPPRPLEPLSREMTQANLGDARLSKRLGRLVDDLAESPAESFPKALPDSAALEGAYRFFSNPTVTPDGILEPHVRETATRCGALDRVLVVHDTTEFEFAGDAAREGLGRLVRPGQGFFGHFSLAVTADGSREPLGVLSLETVIRTAPRVARNKRAKQKQGEAKRWRAGVDRAEQHLAGHARAVHVMDREGDAYSLMVELALADRDFVIRSAHDRVLDGPVRKLREAAQLAPTVIEREVQLSARRSAPGPKGEHFPARRSRPARLSLAATEVVLAPKAPDAGLPKRLPLKLVHVFELLPPRGQPPVEWVLLTTLPVDSPDALAFVVDAYRARWIIEEYFKALKTGCQYEQRQLESAHALLNALAVLVPIAWRLLLLRHLAREADARPATDALTQTQVEVLRAVGKRPLPSNPTVRDALLAVAALGGHIKNNGEPGWQVLGRGYRDLLILEIGWQARRDPPGCDQS